MISQLHERLLVFSIVMVASPRSFCGPYFMRELWESTRHMHETLPLPPRASHLSLCGPGVHPWPLLCTFSVRQWRRHSGLCLSFANVPHRWPHGGVQSHGKQMYNTLSIWTANVRVQCGAGTRLGSWFPAHGGRLITLCYQRMKDAFH